MVDGNLLVRTNPGDLTLNSHGELVVDCAPAPSYAEVQVIGKISNGGKVTTKGVCQSYFDGDFDNTGTLQVDHDMTFRQSGGPAVTFDNTGTVALADGATLSNQVSSCSRIRAFS